MQYVALMKKEKKGFSVEFPDFSGCVTYGSDLDEAVDMAHEALAMYVEEMAEKGEQLPEPTLKKVLLKQECNEGAKAINITVSEGEDDFEEFEVVMHSYLLQRIEKYCDLHGASPADFLAAAARHALTDDIFK